MQQVAPLPITEFDNDLASRGKQARFRGIGNPYQFLDSIGIMPIKEFLYRGANLIDVADTLNVPLTAILIWIEENNLTNEFKDAARLSAEGYIWQGEKLLKEAKDSFTLNKAKAMLEHARFMAGKKDKQQYGTVNENTGGGAGVTYIFNMGAGVPQATMEAMQAEPIDAEYKEVEPVTIELDFTSALDEVPQYVKEHNKEVVKPTIVPVDEPSDRIRDVDRW